MELDLRVWPVATAPIVVDGPRQAFQIRRGRSSCAEGGAWDVAASWDAAVWIWLGGGAGTTEAEPLPWAAHSRPVAGRSRRHGEHVRYQRRLGGVRPLAGTARSDRVTLARH